LFKMIGPSLIPQSRNEIMNEVKGRLNFFENNM
jgi:chaperonin cofactor prefoldin